MGLDFNGSDVHWSYGSFAGFRMRLAASIGIQLHNMEGFGGDISFDVIDHPVKDLLNHSDCDGALTPEQCKVIGPALIEICDAWPDEEDDWDRWKGIQFGVDMIKCGNDGVTLEFC